MVSYMNKKKRNLIGLCFALATTIALTSCGGDDYTYQKEVVDGFYVYNAKFENGQEKSYKLNKAVNAMVIGNCLICDYKWAYEYSVDFDYCKAILNVEDNTFTEYTMNIDGYGNTDYYHIKKDVTKVNQGNIERYLKENKSEFFTIEEDFKDLKYSYETTRYNWGSEEWEQYSSIKNEYEYDSNGNLVTYVNNSNNTLLKTEYQYNEDNKISKKDTYMEYSGEFKPYGSSVYTYDSKSNLIKKESDGSLIEYTYDDKNNPLSETFYYKWTSEEEAVLDLYYEISYEYDTNNHLVLENLKYASNNVEQALCWKSPDYDYTKEYQYDGDKLVYEHDTYITQDGSFFPRDCYEEEYYYSDSEIKNIHTDYSYKYVTIRAIDGRFLKGEGYYSTGELHDTASHTYDSNNNLISRLEYVLGNNNELSLNGKEEYSYDSNQNLLKYTVYTSIGGVLGEKERFVYSYDSNGMLKKIEKYDNNGIIMRLEYKFEWALDKELMEMTFTEVDY